jgi:hypothetical protein
MDIWFIFSVILAITSSVVATLVRNCDYFKDDKKDQILSAEDFEILD